LLNKNVLALCSMNGYLYAGTFAGIFKTGNGDVTWAAVNCPTDTEVWVLYSANGYLYAGTFGDGIFKSADGISWTTINIGLENQLIRWNF
jgi:hypothetical protein